MSLKLYKNDLSPGVRAVLLCAKAIGLELELIDTDILVKKDHLQPNFLELNPQHTVPVLDDDGFILVDSHAIMIYLVQKYKKSSPLFPQDIQKAAVVNHRLHFDTGILFSRGVAITKLIFYEGVKQIPEKYLAELKEAFGIVETYLEQNAWIAGDRVTIADFSIAATLTTWAYFLPVTEKNYPKIFIWLKEMESLPYFNEINKKGVKEYFDLMGSLLK